MGLREYSGNAKRTTITGGISASSTTISVLDGTGYPTGSSAPFVVALDLGLAGEEKVLVTRSSNTLTVVTRGFDDTVASAHNAGASVDHVLSATDIREANAHAFDTAGDPHPQYLTPVEGASLYAGAAHGHSDSVSTSGGSTITASGAAVKGLVVKGAAGQAANLAEFQNSAGTVLTSVTKDGHILGKAVALGTGEFIAGIDAQVHVTNPNAGTRGLVVRGAAGQAANLAEFQNSAGGVLTSVTKDGALRVAAVGVASAFGSEVATDAVLTSRTHDASWKGLVVRGSAGQTANLAEFQNSAGTVLFAVDRDGILNMPGGFPQTHGSAGALSGYLRVYLSGIEFRIPYHNAA